MDEHEGRGPSPRMRRLVADMRTKWRELDRRIAAFDAEFVSWARATYLGQAIGWYHAGQSAGLIGATVGAIIVLVVWGFFAPRRAV